MPSSDPRLITSICQAILRSQPTSVLDLGIGFGKWGALIREYTDIWGFRFYRDEWTTFITGVEIHETYRNPMWDLYDRVVIGDLCQFVGGLTKIENAGGGYAPLYDLTIMVDVLEHLPKNDGIGLIENVLKFSKHFIVSYCNSHQKDVRDNPHEDHVSTWSVGDNFKRYDPEILCGGDNWSALLLTNQEFILEKDAILK